MPPIIGGEQIGILVTDLSSRGWRAKRLVKKLRSGGYINKLLVEDVDREIIFARFEGISNDIHHLVALKFGEDDKVVSELPFELTGKEEYLYSLYGLTHGNYASLPDVLSFGNGESTVNVQIHRPEENEAQFVKTIERNVRAIAKSADKDPEPKRVFIYGPSGTGKTTVATKLISAFDVPWVSINPKWAGMPVDKVLGIIATIGGLASDRKIGLIFDDVDEFIAALSPSGPPDEDEEVLPTPGAVYYRILDLIKHTSVPIIFTTSGQFNIDHIINKCNAFMGMALDNKDREEFWHAILHGPKDATQLVVNENMPIALMVALLKQSKMLATYSRRKNPTVDDVKEALRCFGQRDEVKAGFR